MAIFHLLDYYSESAETAYLEYMPEHLQMPVRSHRLETIAQKPGVAMRVRSCQYGNLLKLCDIERLSHHVGRRPELR